MPKKQSTDTITEKVQENYKEPTKATPKATKKIKQTTTQPTVPVNPFTLVLVESPSKCSTIEKYLGHNYRVMATYGHFRSLVSLKDIIFSENNTSLQLNFKIEDERKQKNINYLGTLIRQATSVILATDDDREGEAIAWHVCDYYGLPVETTPRIVFHEVTSDAIQSAIQNPGRINMNLVQAQFTRQVLDLFIGFKISPMLWTYISNNDKNSLSAGRCQTPALKMVLDNQLQINDTPTEVKYIVEGTFTTYKIPFKLTTTFTTKEEVLDFLEQSKTHHHMVISEENTQASRAPPVPLNTSRLQQVISNDMHLSPKTTMQICQHLYENGLITYMRTENTKYSRTFMEQTRKHLTKEGKLEHLTATPQRLTETNHMAHEAIRPTNLNIGFLSSSKYDGRTCRVYRIIWETSVASCMKHSIVSVKTATLQGPMGLTYKHSTETPIYEGWKSVYHKESENKSVIEQATSNKFRSVLDNLDKSIPLAINTINAKQECTTTRNQLHYTESKLIKLLEEEGIGRPSTFAMIVDKIQTREYVNRENLEGIAWPCVNISLTNSSNKMTITTQEENKIFGTEKNKLVIKPMGIVVSRFLYQHFAPLFNFSYTRETEAL